MRELGIMARRLGLALATFLFLGFAAAAGAQPQAIKPPGNDDCLACHGDPDARRENGTSIGLDDKVFAASTHGPLACVDCHKDLATLQEFPHPEKLAKVACATCHDDVGAKYHDSIHSWAKEKAGLTAAAPACADCHGKHDIRGRVDATARVFRANVPATCGSCHQGIIASFDKGVHAAALKNGNAKAPVCTSCHTAHTIQRADTDTFRVSVATECGTCHNKVVESFRRTFHGKVTELGFSRVAACADCHGAHEILPASNPASKVARANLMQTCGACHKGANESFVQYDPHPNPRNYERSPLMWWVNRFYTVVIAGCFGFFGLHSVLWFRRSWRDGGGRS
jgi:nitrate/TMAO reductase-like tetraheme cytochrome c subunit